MQHRLLTPRWLLAHLLVVVLAGLFILLGLWQLDRLEERTIENQIVLARQSAPTADFEALMGSTAGQDIEFRTVALQGTFDVGEEILIRSRTSNGEAGFHVVTPLVTSDEDAVLVNRGWVPLDLDTPQAVEALPPFGRVDVVGTVRESESAPSLGPEDPDEGVLLRMFWIDIPRIQRQSSHMLAPVYVELRDQSPPQSTPIPIPPVPTEPSEGSHLAYAVQWFSFALIGVVGYAALLRRTYRTKAAGSVSRRDRQPLDDPRSGQ
jgi:surfeit locus 1 family protein